MSTVRRVIVATQNGQVRMEIQFGHGSEPLQLAVKLDPATALVLSGHLESAVHQLLPPEGAAPSHPQTQTAS